MSLIEQAEREAKLLTLALWLADTDRRAVEQLLADAEAGEGTFMPSMARRVLVGTDTPSPRGAVT